MLADASRRFGFLRCFCRGQALKQNNNKIPCSCRGSVMLLRRWMWDFLCYRAGQSVLVSAGETFIGSCQSDKDGIFQTGMVYSTQQDKGIDTNEKKTGDSSMSDGGSDAAFRLHAEYQ